ncbi:hypothetical protein [Flavobacterium sp. F52]|uniref:hypothetical protein n=1 Tax=Flavobacterium sp. F52 TaxID=1202532 RepID=UPI000272DBF1|nr:hypothetical protein [Flavobacterium sp. F52]EJG03203.1 hypothetical protein FF52_03385 [Flavobacterium sp. F52]
MKKKILLFLSILLFVGCAKAVITNTHEGKYKSTTYINTSQRQTVRDESYQISPIINRVAVVPLEKQPKEKSEKPLSPDKYPQSVSKEIIKAYAKLAGTNGAEFIKLMKEPLSVVDKPDDLKTDYSKVTVRLNFTFVNEFLKNDDLHHPNIRIEYLNTTVTPISDNFVFYDVDKFQNVVKSVDVGTLNRTQNVKFGAELNGSYGAGIENTTGSSNGRNLTGTQNLTQNSYDPNNNLTGVLYNGATDTVTSGSTNTGKTTLGLNAAAKANYENAVGITENANLKHDILSSGYSFDNKHLTVMKRGFPLNEIPNETYVTTTLKFKNSDGNNTAVSSTVFKGYELFNAGRPVKADQAVFKSRTVNYNKCSGEKKISLQAVYDGMIRVVANKSKNNKGEYDDVVEYRTFENIRIPDIELDLNDYCSKVYKIVIEDGKKEYTLYIKSANTALMEMQFFQDDNYEEFITWLTNITKTSDYKDLKTSKYIFSFSCIDFTTGTSLCSDVELIGDTMDAAKLTALKNFLKGKTFKAKEIN